MLVTRETLTKATSSLSRTLAKAFSSQTKQKPTENEPRLVMPEGSSSGRDSDALTALATESEIGAVQAASLALAIQAVGQGIKEVERIASVYKALGDVFTTTESLRTINRKLTPSLDILWAESIRGRPNTDALAVGRDLAQAFSNTYGAILRNLDVVSLNTVSVAYEDHAQQVQGMLHDASVSFCRTLKWRGLRHESVGADTLKLLGKLYLCSEATVTSKGEDSNSRSNPVYQEIARALLYYVSDPYSQSLQQVLTTFDFIDALDGITLQRNLSHPGDIAFDPDRGTVAVVSRGRALAWMDSPLCFLHMKELRGAAFNLLRATVNSVSGDYMTTSSISRMRVVREFVSGKNGLIRSIQDEDRRILSRRAQLRPASIVLGHSNCIHALRSCYVSSFIVPSMGKPCVIFDESASGARLQLAHALNFLLKVGGIVALYMTHDGNLRLALIKWYRRESNGTATVGIEFISGDASLVSVTPKGRSHPSESGILITQRDQPSNTLILIHQRGLAHAGDVDIHVQGICCTGRPIAFDNGDGIEVVTYAILDGES